MNVYDMIKYHKSYGKNRILLVDDEEFCITTMIALLEISAIDCPNFVDTCMNGKEAVEKVTDAYNHNIEFSMIFMDFSMPIMNGIESSSAIRDYLSRVKGIQR